MAEAGDGVEGIESRERPRLEDAVAGRDLNADSARGTVDDGPVVEPLPKRPRRGSSTASGKPKRRHRATWPDRFLEALEKTYSVEAACFKLGIPKKRAYRERDRNSGFRARWDEITAKWDGELEGSALRRAIQGSKRLMLYKGAVVQVMDAASGKLVPVVETVYETALTIFLMKTRMPQLYSQDPGEGGATAHEHAAAVRKAIAETEDFFVTGEPSMPAPPVAPPSTPTGEQPSETSKPELA